MLTGGHFLSSSLISSTTSCSLLTPKLYNFRRCCKMCKVACKIGMNFWQHALVIWVVILG